MAPPHETSIQLVTSRLATANNKIIRNSKTLPGSPRSFRDYNEYLQAMPDLQRLYMTMTREHNTPEVVASYVILKTANKDDSTHTSIDRATDYMFERRDGDQKM